jgi:hypothetical protein
MKEISEATLEATSNARMLNNGIKFFGNFLKSLCCSVQNFYDKYYICRRDVGSIVRAPTTGYKFLSCGFRQKTFPSLL